VPSPTPPSPPELPDGDAESPPTPAEQLVELSALTGGLAHEIRNPLSTLKVNLQLLDEDWRQVESPDKRRPCEPQEIARRSRGRIATLLEEADHLERILQDFLQYVGKRELRHGSHDVNKLVSDLVDFYRPQAEVHRIDLRCCLADEPPVCEIDLTAIKQAILNLLINAQQAMPDGGQIYIRVSKHGDSMVRIDVIDTGPGIPEDGREKVFQAYYSTKKAGSGLGLATTRQLVRAHGGQILLYSEPGRGSCFTILLPRQQSRQHGCVVSPK
jgi:two-component system, NtrC family, sensor histidine kinase HydH